MSARTEPASAVTTLWGWAVCLGTSWLAIQTVDLAFQVLS